MTTNVNFIAKNNAVNNIYANKLGVPFPAGIETVEENENENEETQTKGEDESTEK